MGDGATAVAIFLNLRSRILECTCPRSGAFVQFTRDHYPFTAMAGVYEEVRLEDMLYEPTMGGYTYSCPCGDLFYIAGCPTC
eukprot:gene559-gene1370